MNKVVTQNLDFLSSDDSSDEDADKDLTSPRDEAGAGDKDSPEQDGHDDVTYKNAASTQMLVADEIQRGLAEVDEEGEELEERGLSVEKSLREERAQSLGEGDRVE